MAGFFWRAPAGQAIRCKSSLRRSSLLWAFHCYPSRASAI
jgi:hypothetical protein